MGPCRMIRPPRGAPDRLVRHRGWLYELACDPRSCVTLYGRDVLNASRRHRGGRSLATRMALETRVACSTPLGVPGDFIIHSRLGAAGISGSGLVIMYYVPGS
jgi:hypothetical protein